MALSEKDLKFYEQNGYIVVENIVDAPTLKAIRDAITALMEDAAAGKQIGSGRLRAEAETGPGGGTATAAPAKQLRKLNELVPGSDFFKSVAASPKILDIVSQLTGGAKKISLYSDQVFLKPAHCGTPKPLHQDNSYFRVTPHSAGVTCWMAVDDATIENGCMGYIPGTHKLGLLPHKQVAAAHLTPEGEGFGEEVRVPVKAGSCIFHHLLVLHSSPANNSDKSRRAWALHYANRDAEACARKWEDMVELR